MRMEGRKALYTRGIVLCSLFAALIAAGAFIRIPIPNVPFTLQFLFTNLAGLLLGKKLGSISVAVYISVGLLGIPVFTAGGGIGYVFQPTFGYILGFLAGTYLAGYIMERSRSKGFKASLAAGFVNLIVVYSFGMVYYYLIVNYYAHAPIGVWALILYCFLLVVPGDIAICFASAALYGRLTPVLKRGGVL